MAQRRTLAAVWMVMLVGACGPGMATSVGDDESTTIGDETTDGETTDETPTDPTAPSNPTEDPDDTDTGDTGDTSSFGSVALIDNRDVDILFVVDNSGSMSEEQARLAAGVAALVGAIDDLDWRIGVTTTDVGNPRCTNTSPENGSLVLSSCIDRVAAGEFTTQDADFSAACTDRCSKSDAELEVLPTATEFDTNQVPRKWVEQIAGQLNIGGVTAVEALQCYLPQGVTGCGFEGHLEAMFRAVALTKDKNAKQNFGFLREAAGVMLVAVSDETDCSSNPEHKDIFTTNKVFWNDPADVAPTSAMCWRAGVSCVGDAPTFETCRAEKFDDAGMVTEAEADAVLHPVARYIDFLQELEHNKQLFDPDMQLQMALISGVPVGYEDFESELVYEDSPDQAFQDGFGIGPGCIVGDPQAPESVAVPPVREREVAEAFNVGDDHRNLYSVCDQDYAGALADIGERIRAQVRPTCMPNCVLDVEPATPILEPNCSLSEENLVTSQVTPVEPCQAMADTWIPPAGKTVCFVALVDQGSQTPSAGDDMSAACVDGGFNLEFKIVRTAPKQPGSILTASCALSPDKDKDCPKL